MTQNNESLGERLRRLLEKSGLTQQNVADKLDIPRNTVWRWINNKATPESKNLHDLATLLHVSVDELLNGAPEETWVLTVKIADNFTQEVIDVSKRVPCVSSITTTPTGGFMCLGGDYSLWADDTLFKKMINDLKKYRDVVLQNGRAMGGIKD